MARWRLRVEVPACAAGLCLSVLTFLSLDAAAFTAAPRIAGKLGARARAGHTSLAARRGEIEPREGGQECGRRVGDPISPCSRSAMLRSVRHRCRVVHNNVSRQLKCAHMNGHINTQPVQSAEFVLASSEGLGSALCTCSFTEWCVGLGIQSMPPHCSWSRSCYFVLGVESNYNRCALRTCHVPL